MKANNLRKEFAIRAASLREGLGDSTGLAKRLDSFIEDAAKELDAKQLILDEMFKHFDENGIGAIYKNSLNQFGFVLKDASEEGAYRYLRISVNVTAHFANNVTGGFTRLRGV